MVETERAAPAKRAGGHEQPGRRPGARDPRAAPYGAKPSERSERLAPEGT